MTKILLAMLIAIISTGCGTLTKEIHVELNKPVRISNGVMSVALITAKSASEVDLKLVKSLASKLKAKGITITEDPKKADYTIALAAVTGLGIKDEDGHMVSLTALSTGLAGAGVAYKVSGGSGSAALGAGIGSAVGGAILAYTLKDSSLSLKVDVVFSQNKVTPVVQQKSRIFSTVRQMHLNEEDGREALIEKISTKIADLFKP